MINAELIAVQPLDNYVLLLTFDNKEQRLFDMKPYLDKGIFKELKGCEMFNTVHLYFDTIAWANKADLAPEILYPNSQPLRLLKSDAFTEGC
ncbi:MAG: DUF2442 domain-containing protein [Tannerella sp.]|jgi:hypothetical protein|nr:DUF2442 domain-containing protein [Tannerella sp.]